MRHSPPIRQWKNSRKTGALSLRRQARPLEQKLVIFIIFAVKMPMLFKASKMGNRLVSTVLQ